MNFRYQNARLSPITNGFNELHAISDFLLQMGDEVPPVNYRSEDLIKSLNLRLGQHIFLETGDMKHQMNPLLGAPDMAVPARVVEYLTQEIGILK